MATPAQPGALTLFAESRRRSVAGFVRLLVGAGLVNALIASFLLCRVPASHAPTLAGLLFRAAIYVALGASAGTAGIWYYWTRSASPFHSEAPISLRLFALSAAAGWVWAPPVVLLSRADSPGTGLVAIAGAAVLAGALRKAIPSPLDPDEAAAAPDAWDPEMFAATLRTPPRQAHGYWIAGCFYAAAYEVANGWFLDAAGLLAVCGFLFMWKWTLPDSEKKYTSRNAALRLAAAATVAVLVTLSALLNGIEHRNRLEAEGLARANAGSGGDTAGKKSRESAGSAEAVLSGYESIILWPVPEKKPIVAPVPALVSPLAAGARKPVVIHFDGAYWYFQPPGTRPSPQAHQAHGTPLAVDVRSTNFIPLTMEAHQMLGAPVRLACCRELQVAVENSETWRGGMELGVLLTDSNAPGKPDFYLGQQTVLSNQPGALSPRTAPIREVLHFPIPAGARIRKFDEITIIFVPDATRMEIGPKIAIDEFELLPR
jgi:hypothetical protein